MNQLSVATAMARRNTEGSLKPHLGGHTPTYVLLGSPALASTSAVGLLEPRTLALSLLWGAGPRPPLLGSAHTQVWPVCRLLPSRT